VHGQSVAFIGLTLVALTIACGASTVPSGAPGGSETPPDAGAAGADTGTAASPYAAECAEAASPPVTSLVCTGLYSDILTKAIAPGVRAYAPAVALWADNADKGRWIYLPPGTTIDATDPDEWTFPVGTKVWKQFSRDGIVVETRMFQKTMPNYWVRTTYAWNADLTEAIMSPGGNITLPGDAGVYHIPTADECDQCHKGRNDHLMGFEQVSLGLQGATGLTLPELVAEKLITPAPKLVDLTVGDDGTGRAVPSMKWLHINCGVSCHNDNSNSTAYAAGMNLRLDPTLLDGRSSAGFGARTTTLDVRANNPMWSGQIRIIPGDPTDSLLYKLITNRGTSNSVNDQMPPIATFIVDAEDTMAVGMWIGAMPAADGGT